MKSNLSLSLLGVIAIFAGATANAQLNSAVVDMQECLNQYYKTAQEVEKINTMAKEKRTNLDERSVDMQNLTKKLAELDKVVRDDALNDARRQEALAEMQRVAQERQTKAKEISDAQRKYQAEILAARQKMEVALVEEIRGILAAMAAANGYDLVHDKSFLPKANKALVYVSPKVPDITAALVAKLNENAPAGGAPEVVPAGTGEAPAVE